jgi:hypothetical protein
VSSIGVVQLSHKRPRFGASTSNRWLMAAAVVIVLVTVLSFIPLRTKMELHTKGRLHDIDHVLAFGAVAFLLGRAFRSRAGHVLSAGAAMGIGYCLEYMEHTVNRVEMEWDDVAVDAIAVLLFSFLAWFLQSREERRAKQTTGM